MSAAGESQSDSSDVQVTSSSGDKKGSRTSSGTSATLITKRRSVTQLINFRFYT